MILNRLGNKKSIAMDIYPHFSDHKMRIDLFFGAGGAFFNMPKAKYNILNDYDDDVTNLFLLVQNQKEALVRAIELLPISSTLVKYWKNNTETDPLKKALRFLLLSNFTYLGKGDTLRLSLDNSKKILLKNIEPTFEALKDVKITTKDFREVISNISFSEKVLSKKDTYLFIDPIYFETEHYYNVPKWTRNDSLDCLNIMDNSGINAGMCEFDHPTIVAEAKKRNFNIIYIKERQNIKKRSQEIFITNYESPQYKLNI